MHLTYLTKYETSQAYGGPEEGGWWYDLLIPQWKFSIPLPEKLAYALARKLNDREHKRRKAENTYEYTSVLSYNDTFYEYGMSDTFRPTQPERPHYE